MWPHRGMLPVQDDLRNILHGMQEVVVPPLVPVNGHGAVFVHAVRQRQGNPSVIMSHLPTARPTSEMG